MNIVVIGGGHAAAQLCSLLGEKGLGGQTQMVCEEAELPYHRPPLSKTYLKSEAEALALHRTGDWFAERSIRIHSADPAVAIDRAAKTVTLHSGTVLPYDQLVLATGTRARRLPHLDPALQNVAVLRDAVDAAALRSRLARMAGAAGSRLTVLGGGFIGLEIAATARVLGLEVEVLEGMPRLLARSVSPELAAHVLEHHRASGVDIRLGVKVDGFESEAGVLESLTVDGVRQPVQLLVMGIGAVPETALAQAAGLEVDNGIVVDASLRTSDPAIFAIGDCTSFPAAGGRRLRLESVQNANDQAKTAAAVLAGETAQYKAVPWFWSEQGSMRLQMVGLLPAQPSTHKRPGATPQSFSLFHYDGERLACVESANAPLDHMMARRMLDAGKSPAAQQVADPAVPLKTLT
ncbi:MAG TPA: FAD-dependent oxidoreductase [Ramlibacter sp.]|nr:FAD-dependent oxidoreductase [Ramlibacter sp.]